MDRDLDASGILIAAARGQVPESNRLAALVYDELKRIANHYLSPNDRAHGIQATSIVHDAYVRLVRNEDVSWEGRVHFLATAAVAVRRVLADRARRDLAAKRGGGWKAVTLDGTCELAGGKEVEVLDLDASLSKLKAVSERQAQIVELRFFGGLSNQEIAQAVAVSVRTVEEDWRMARAWLARELSRADDR